MLLLLFFIRGACAFMFGSIAAICFYHRHPKAPYREAFGWVALVSGLQILFGVSRYVFPDVEILQHKMMSIAVDAAVIPLFLFEIECIYRQNIKEYTWAQRRRKLALHELPFLVFLIISILTDWEYEIYAIALYVIIYVTIAATIELRQLRRYERIISYTSNIIGRGVHWVYWIFATNLLIIFCYGILCPFFASFGYIPLIVYLTFNMALTCTHAYFIYKQRPENTQEIQKICKILEKEQHEIEEKLLEITQLSNEIETNAEKIKRKADIKEYNDAFTLQHPHFNKRLEAVCTTKMTRHDQLLCRLIYDDQKIADIARMVGVNSRSVEMARGRLRKKFGLTHDQNLMQFIREKADTNV